MAVLKNKTQGRYVIVCRSIVEDRSLKLVDRGLLLTLLSLPDQWNFTINGMASILPDGRDTIQKSIERLVEKGYLTKAQDKSNNGKFGQNIIEVHEIPIIQPITEKPLPENTSTEKPIPRNPQQLNNNKYNTKELNKKIYSSKTREEKITDDKSSKWTDAESDFYGI